MEPKVEPIAASSPSALPPNGQTAGTKDSQPAPPSAGEIILPVECGPNKATLYLSRLCQGSRGPCVLFRGSWLTPNEFQYVSGRETAKDWKRSIRHGGKSLKLLVAKGVMSLNPPRCSCENCGGTSPQAELNKENIQDVKPLSMDNSAKPHDTSHIDSLSTSISSLPGASLAKPDHTTQLGFASPIKPSNGSSLDPENNSLTHPRDLNGNTMPNCINSYNVSQPIGSGSIPSCGGGEQRPSSMRDCVSSEPASAPKPISATPWPASDSAGGGGVVDRSTCGDVDVLQQQRAACGVVQPTATIPPTVIPPVSAPTIPGVPPLSGGDAASNEAYAYYIRSLQSLGHQTPSVDDLNGNNYGEFLRRYYQWYSEVNRKHMYGSPSGPGSVPPTHSLTSSGIPRPSTGAFDPLLHYEYMQRTVPYYIPPGLYPSGPTATAVRLPTATSSSTYPTSSFVSPSTVMPPTSTQLMNSTFTNSLTNPLSNTSSACPGILPTPTSAAADCALGGTPAPNPAIKRSYEATYLDLDKAEKQRKIAESSLLSPQISAPGHSPYLSYPGFSLSSPSYLGWDRRVPTTDPTATLLDYERHRHLDPFVTSIPSVYGPHSSTPFSMRPFVDSCKVLS